MDPRLQSIARNEGLLRAVNQQIERISADLAGRSWTPGDQIQFHCECGATCDARVRLTVAEFDRVHEQDDRFVVADGHENPEIERVVERTDRYAVVDKLPEYEPAVGADGATGSDS